MTLVHKLPVKYLSDYKDSDPIVLEFCQEAVLNLAIKEPNYWAHALSIIEKNYAVGIDTGLDPLIRDTDNTSLPVEIAQKITDYPEKYPRLLVTKAEAKYRESFSSKIIPIGVIAQREGWFNEDQ